MEQPTVEELRERHVKGFRSTSDEVWDREPICTGCGHAWPCDTAVALAAVPADRVTDQDGTE